MNYLSLLFLRFPAKPSPAAARIPPRAIAAIDASSPVSGSAGPLGASGVVGGVTGGTTGVGGVGGVGRSWWCCRRWCLVVLVVYRWDNSVVELSIFWQLRSYCQDFTVFSY